MELNGNNQLGSLRKKTKMKTKMKTRMKARMKAMMKTAEHGAAGSVDLQNAHDTRRGLAFGDEASDLRTNR